jgi:hypothetical protein
MDLTAEWGGKPMVAGVCKCYVSTSTATENQTLKAMVTPWLPSFQSSGSLALSPRHLENAKNGSH